MLVDGGRTGAGLTRRLQAQPVDQRHFDVVMCTHIDLDHIGGLLPMFRTPLEGFGVGDVWFNSRHHLVGDTLGVDQGEELTDLLEGRWPWNEAFGRRAVVAPAEVHTLPGLTVTVLAPDVSGLERLLEHWPEVVEEGSSGTEPGDLPGDALGDDDDFPLDSLDELLRTRYRRDPSAANGSSIAVLLTADDGARVLLGADAPAEPLVAALQPLTANFGPGARRPVQAPAPRQRGKREPGAAGGARLPPVVGVHQRRAARQIPEPGRRRPDPRPRGPPDPLVQPPHAHHRPVRPPVGPAGVDCEGRLPAAGGERDRPGGGAGRTGAAGVAGAVTDVSAPAAHTSPSCPHPHVRPGDGRSLDGQERRRLPRRDR
jgi:hypothetical protein